MLWFNDSLVFRLVNMVISRSDLLIKSFEFMFLIPSLGILIVGCLGKKMITLLPVLTPHLILSGH